MPLLVRRELDAQNITMSETSFCNGARKAGAIAEVEQIVADFDTTTRRNNLDNVLTADIRIQANIGHIPEWVDVVNGHKYGWSSIKQKYIPTATGIAFKTKQKIKHAKYYKCIGQLLPICN